MLNNTAFLSMVANTAVSNFTPDVSFLQANTLQLNVFYVTMGYMAIQDAAAVTIDVLIAQFGVNVGIFLGMAFLSLVEIFEVIFYMVYFKMVIDKKKSKKDNQQPV